MFAAARPPRTTLFHISAMMKPNAAPRDAAIVFRTSAMESCFSSAIFCPGGRRLAYPIKGLCFTVKALVAVRRTYSARRSPAGGEDVPVERIEVTLRDIDAALPIVREVGRHTPTVPFSGDEDVWLKLENLQRLGAFKIRGVWNRISQLTDAERRRGVSTISSGNHGLAVAWAARRLGLPCTVRVPEGAVGRKVEAIHAQGAKVSPLSRSDLIDAHERETWRSWPSAFLHPFAHPATIAGQGTIGREIAEDLPDVRTVLVPVGGGGLVSGIGTAIKGLVPQAQVFGVQAEGAAPLPVSLRTRQSHRIDRPQTIADGIGIGMILPPMVAILSRVLDGAFVVTDAEIRGAMRRLALEAKIVAEPAGAAAFAAWIRYRDQLRPPVVAVVSGGNVDPNLLVEGGDLRGGEHVAFLDPAIADRAHRRRSEEDRAGRDGAAPDVGLAADVDDLRHRLRMGARAISPSRLCQAFRARRAGTIRGEGFCQVATSDVRSIIYEPRGSSRLRADGMRAAKGWAR